MDLGVHLPLMQFGEEPLSLRRLEATVDAARDCGFAAVSANDHLVFQTPWLDGLAALASIVGRSGELTLATTVSLAVLRGPVPLAKALTALDVLSEGRLIAGELRAHQVHFLIGRQVLHGGIANEAFVNAVRRRIASWLV